jgi:hypothetical protein
MRSFGEISLPCKSYSYINPNTKRDNILVVTEQGFYLLYEKIPYYEQKLMQSGYFIGMEEGETEDGRKYVEYREEVPDDHEGFTDIYRFFPEEEVMEHEVIPDAVRY